MKDNERITEEEFSVMLLKFPELIYALYYREEDEIDRLNNIIDKLEKHLVAMSKIYEEEYKDIDTSEHYKSMLNKLKELKEEK